MKRLFNVLVLLFIATNLFGCVYRDVLLDDTDYYHIKKDKIECKGVSSTEIHPPRSSAYIAQKDVCIFFYEYNKNLPNKESKESLELKNVLNTLDGAQHEK